MSTTMFKKFKKKWGRNKQDKSSSGSPVESSRAGTPSSIASDQPPQHEALEVMGSSIEKSLKILRGLSGLIPVPGLKGALDALCECIGTYHVCAFILTFTQK